MTQHVQQGNEEISVRGKPPPNAEREMPLFQTMSELHHRHGNAPATKDRLYLWGGGFLVGSIVFAVLYLTIHFLE